MEGSNRHARRPDRQVVLIVPGHFDVGAGQRGGGRLRDISDINSRALALVPGRAQLSTLANQINE